MTEDGTINASLDDYPDALDAWESHENVKLITAWYPELAEPLSSGLEIVPTHDPFALTPDDKLRLRVTLNGTPIPETMVAYHGDWRGVTDSDGQINIRIRHRGLQIIAASIEEPSTRGTADRVVRTAILQFELP